MKKFIIEYKWLIFFTIGVIFITSLPYWFGFALQNESYKFSGFLIGVEDGNSYLAKMMLGESGDWFFTTPYTAYPQVKFLAFLPYILIGKLAGQSELRLQLIILFHLFRWFGIIFLTRETYLFARIFVKEKSTSILITTLTMLGGGLGWLVIIFPQLTNNRLPLEFYSPETFGFLSIFGLPHLLFGRAFLFQSIRKLLTIKEIRFDWNKKYLISGVSLLLSGIFQPLNIFIGWFVILAYYFYLAIISKEFIAYIKKYIFWIIPSAPLFFYNFFSFLFDPYLSTWEQQNRIISPPVIDYIFAYGAGLLIIFLVYKSNMAKLIQNKLFINIWILLIPVLVYFPINLQRRLVEGVWICLSIYIGIYITHSTKKIWKGLLLLAFFFSSVIFTMGSIQSVQNLSFPIYCPQTLIDVSQVLEEDISKGDVILAPHQESNFLPTLLPVKVLIGHGPESKNLAEISNNIDLFFQADLTPLTFYEMVDEFQIRFILVPSDFKINIDKILETYNSVQLVYMYENNDYTVLKVDE